ncbi:MAG: acyl-CoA dehydrogenase [Paracoccus denitrificans]|uniref:Acyl-CoA dehydrogenase n=1 Tax=Paracoccus denitrificans TaxID=266 RepID=A0A533I602_PARDE|nr:MAG: acyl-CoA dehydrogenase [Paracoccus denitrificans]
MEDQDEAVCMVRDSAAGVLAGDLPRNRALRFTEPGHDPARLRDFAGLGWPLLRLPEAQGGLGLGVPALVALAVELGRVLSPEPVVGLALVASLWPDAGVLDGSRIVLPAFAPFGGALLSYDGGRISGTASVLLGGAAEGWLVQTAGGAALVRAGAPGLTVTQDATHDGGHLAHLVFDATPAEAVPGDIEALRDEAALAHAGYQLGLAEQAFEITLAYLKDRRQFDRPIGSFQVLQHRLVDLFMELQLARAALEQAAGAGQPTQTSVALVQVGQAADLVTRTAIQLHGGIGYSDEADIGLYLRKAMVLKGLFGSARFHRLRALDIGEAAA